MCTKKTNITLRKGCGINNLARGCVLVRCALKAARVDDGESKPRITSFTFRKSHRCHPRGSFYFLLPPFAASRNR